MAFEWVLVVAFHLTAAANAGVGKLSPARVRTLRQASQPARARMRTQTRSMQHNRQFSSSESFSPPLALLSEPNLLPSDRIFAVASHPYLCTKPCGSLQVRQGLIPVNLNALRLFRLARALPLLSAKSLGPIGDAGREATRILQAWSLIYHL